MKTRLTKAQKAHLKFLAGRRSVEVDRYSSYRVGYGMFTFEPVTFRALQKHGWVEQVGADEYRYSRQTFWRINDAGRAALAGSE